MKRRISELIGSRNFSGSVIKILLKGNTFSVIINYDADLDFFYFSHFNTANNLANFLSLLVYHVARQVAHAKIVLANYEQHVEMETGDRMQDTLVI